jgi:hypothetical protein
VPDVLYCNCIKKILSVRYKCKQCFCNQFALHSVQFVQVLHFVLFQVSHHGLIVIYPGSDKKYNENYSPGSQRNMLLNRDKNDTMVFFQPDQHVGLWYAHRLLYKEFRLYLF